MKQALVLFAHGARDPRWAEPFRRLAERVREARPEAVVELAFLELMEPRLPQCVAGLVAQGIGQVTVVPVFLGQGGHVLRDLPVLIGQLQEAYPGLKVEVAGAVGEEESVQQAMAGYCASLIA